MPTSLLPLRIISVAAIFIMIAVAFGAFGAHGLKKIVSPEMLSVWNTAVLYQLVHGLGAILVAVLFTKVQSRMLLLACYTMLCATLIFSGSLYILVLTGKHWLGAITPIGGLLFIVAWFIVAVAAWRKST